jgi:hypothetical protein
MPHLGPQTQQQDEPLLQVKHPSAPTGVCGSVLQDGGNSNFGFPLLDQYPGVWSSVRPWRRSGPLFLRHRFQAAGSITVNLDMRRPFPLNPKS